MKCRYESRCCRPKMGESDLIVIVGKKPTNFLMKKNDEELCRVNE